jgi:hypothetical protein
VFVSICKNIIQKREKREKKKPNSIPVRKALDNFVSLIAKRTGTNPNQARKLSPRGWKERDKTPAEIKINKRFFI